MTLSTAQHEHRATGLGGSDAGAALGLNPYKTPVKLYLEKIGEIEPDDLSDNDAVHFGTVLEDTVAAEYERRTGNKVRRDNRSLRHAEHNWMLGHIDRKLVGQPALLECKTAGAWMASDWGPSGSDDVPDAYLVQCLHYLIVTGYKRADLAVLIGGQTFRHYTIGFDRDLADVVIEREREFWQCVETRTPPEIVTAQDIADLYPVDSGDQVLADPALVDAHRDLVKVRETIKARESDKAGIEKRIKAALGEAAELIAPDGSRLVTWKTSESSKVLDTKRLKDEQPDIAERYTVERPGSRRFLVKNPAPAG
jgi:putative phage-type endonuclease